jgi:outer membrane protein assembly factor BamB
MIITGFLALVVLAWWLTYDPAREIKLSVPGLDSIPNEQEGDHQKVTIGEFFEQYDEEQSWLTGSWTGFRGKNRDNIVGDTRKLISSFGSSGPRKEWSVDLGEGHAAPVIHNGKVYILDYLEEKKMDALRCFSLITGKELWRRSYGIHIKRNHGMSRTVPALAADFLVTLGPMGHVMCVDPKNGDLKWTLDLVEQYGTEIPFWYTGQCPLIHQGEVILAPGGKALMIGVDGNSGEILWETPNPDSIQMSHSSIMPMEFGGEQIFVYAGIGGVAGISATEQNRGQLRWVNKEFVPSVIAPSPIKLSRETILITAGYGAGSAIIKVSQNNEKASVIQSYKPKEGLASEQQTPLILDGYIYAILPKDAGSFRNQLACYKLNDLNNPVWTSGKTLRLGLGPYIYADKKFYIVSDDGTLTIAKADAGSFQILDSQRVIEGHDAWGPIAIADGRLLMRDSKKMVCLNISG